MDKDKKNVGSEHATKKQKKIEKLSNPSEHSGIPVVKDSPATTVVHPVTKPIVPTDSFKECVKLREKLRTDWNNGESGWDMNLIGVSLEAAKLHLINLNYLESTGQDIPPGEEVLARDILEFGVLYSVLKAEPDMELFSSYMSQLKTYYHDYGKTIDISTHKYEILGSNLLYLLTKEDLAEFHVEVERILYPVEDSESIIQNMYIKRAIELERALGEGRFSQIHAEDGPQMKSRLWCYFVQNLMAGTRLKIAETIEAAYEKLSAEVTMDKLKFNNENELHEFAAQRNWNLMDGVYCFNCKVSQDDFVPAKHLLVDFLGYARELEIII